MSGIVENMIITQVKPFIINKPEYKFETLLFLPPGEGRKGEGGLRKKGYFKHSYKLVNDMWYICDTEGVPIQSVPEEVQEKIREYINKVKRDTPSNFLPLISVITVVFNGEKYLEQTIESIINQTYPNMEYIIIDGGSTDGTLDIIKKYEDKIDYWVSEKDNGIYDAMNKGLRLTTGYIVGFLNSDDFYVHNKVIKKVVMVFEITKVDTLFADLIYVKREDPSKIIRYYDSSQCIPKNFKRALLPAHPTFFAKMSLYRKYGYFKTDYKIAADFDLMARLLYKYKSSYTYLKEPIIKMRFGGISTSIRSLYLNTIEQLRVCRENGINSNIFWILSKYVTKLQGFFIKKRS